MNLYTLLSDIFAGLSPEEQARTAIRCEGQSCTYRQLSAAIDSFADELLARGIRPGEHVGLWSFNSLNWVAAFFAIVKVGAVAVLPNYSLPGDEVEAQFRRTDIVALLYGNSVALKRNPDAAGQLAQRLKLRELIDLRAPENEFFTRCEHSPEHQIELFCRVSSDRPGRTAFLIFTTGTTSAPKAVMLHQRGLLATAEDLALRTEALTGDSACIALPLFHVFGIQWLTTYLLQHKTVYLQDRIHPENIISEVERFHVPDLVTVGTIYFQLISHPGFSRIRDIVRFCQTGGGRITPTQFALLEGSFTDAKLFNGLGMTEAHGGVTEPLATDSADRRAASLGRLGSYLEGKLVGPDGKELPPGQIGELCIRGLTLMNGYYPPGEAADDLDEEGWFRTGDLGSFDAAGNLCLAGRTKDIIIRGGENVAPLDVETAIIELGGVRDTKVFGVPHPVYGESVECCLIPEDPEGFSADALREALKSRLAGFKIPSHFFAFDFFPLMSNGKLDEPALKALLLTRLQSET